MKKNGFFYNRLGKILLPIILILLSSSLMAEEYVIGPDDVLDISFWQDPEKNEQVRVDKEGMISMDIIGKVKAAGKTPTELQREIVQLIKPFVKAISQATVRINQYNFNYVFLIGQINQTGKMTFEKIPELWDLINEAGGTGEFADLSRVTIIRGGEKDAGKVEVVNIQKAIAEGTLHKLPKIRRMDTIEIPRTPGDVQAGAIANITDKKNMIYVLGAVQTPGPIGFEENLDLIDALALADGPNPTADLRRARLLLKDGEYTQTVEIDLEKFMETGKPSRFVLQREDTFIIPQKDQGFLGVGVPTIVASLGIITSIFVIIDQAQGTDAGNVAVAR